MPKVNKWIFWTPRILSVLFMLFLAMFSLDVFEGNYGFWGTIMGLFMHNIPALILLVIVIISWKYELVGAVIFILAGLLYAVITAVDTANNWIIVLSWSLIISGPAFLIGILFLINWLKKKK